MAKTPTGPRRTPKVATGPSPKFQKPSGSYEGTAGNKPPTGNRPVPSVAKNTAPGPKSKNKSKPAVPHTPMGTPKNDALTGRSKAHGGA